MLDCALVEQELTRYAQVLLDDETFSSSHDLFDAGGDSVIAAQIFIRAQALFGFDLPIEVFFENAKINSLVQCMAEQSDATIDA